MLVSNPLSGVPHGYVAKNSEIVAAGVAPDTRTHVVVHEAVGNRVALGTTRLDASGDMASQALRSIVVDLYVPEGSARRVADSLGEAVVQARIAYLQVHAVRHNGPRVTVRAAPPGSTQIEVADGDGVFPTQIDNGGS